MTKYLEFFRHHERLILSFLAALVLGGCLNLLFGYLEHRDQRIYDRDKAVLETQVKQNADIAVRNANLATQYQTLAQQVLNENTKLEQAISARDAATKKQQAADATLPPTDLAARWGSLLGGLPLGTVAVNGSAYAITDAGARKTVSMLEAVPQLESDLADTRTELAGKDKLLASAGERVTGLTEQVTGLNNQIVIADRACKDEITLVKAQARRGKLKWFGAGYVAGLLTRPLVKVFGL